MENAIQKGMETRSFGEYAADKRAKLRIHANEQQRINGGKKESVEDEDVAMDFDEEGTYLAKTYLAQPAVENIAIEEAEFDVDLTALAGPPSAHEILDVVLHGP